MLQRAPSETEIYPHAQDRHEIDQKVALVLQVMREDGWQTVGERLRGTITGHSATDDQDPYTEAYLRSIMADAPYVPTTTCKGIEFREPHPHIYDCEPQRVGEYIARLHVLPIELTS